MKLPKVYFAGCNGFGQFKELEKIVTKFVDVNFENIYDGRQSEIKCVKFNSSWKYLAFSINNLLYVCGFINENFQLTHKIPFESNIQDISCNEKYCLVLLNNGILYKLNIQTLEINEINSLIINRTDALPEKKNIFGQLSVDQENSLNKENDEIVTHIASGRSFSIAITNKNTVYNIPVKIFNFPTHVKIKKISCGNEHCLMLTSNGDIYAFGSSSRGQLGLGELESKEHPELIEALAGVKIIDIAAGGWHSAAISAFNDLYVWGWNVNGQLGFPLHKKIEITLNNGQIIREQQKNSTVFATPILVDLPKDESDHGDNSNDVFENHYSARNVYAGTRHTIIKTDEGVLVGSGWNKYGQLATTDLDQDIDQFKVIETEFRVNCDSHIICGDWCTILMNKNY